MERLFVNTWVYVGHDSQVPNAGDYFGTTLGAQPVLMVRHEDDVVRVLYNRCPHKGTRITTETCGNTGKFFRCPYHAWSFRTDGSPVALPLPAGYENSAFAQSQAARGLTPVRHVHNHRGFVFAKLSGQRPGLRNLFRRLACPALITWSTARRWAGWKSPAACCATCTTATGRCWSRTRPIRVIRWSPICPRPARRSSCGSAVASNPPSRWRWRFMRPSWPLTSFTRKWAFVPGITGTATPASVTPSIRTIRRFPATSNRWQKPMAKFAPRRFWTRTGTTRSISPI